MNKLALFDLDGTIFDTKDVNYYAYQEALTDFGYNLDYNYYCQECFGRHYKYFLPLLGVQNVDIVERIHQRKKDCYSRYLDKARVNWHLIFILKDMARDYYRVIVTTASRKNTEEILSYYNLLGEFDMMLTQENINNPKPNPEGFMLAMNKLKVKPEDTIIFEDSEVGIEAAQATGATIMMIRQF